MESDRSQSFNVYNLLGWFETHKKPVIVGAGVAVGLGLIIGFFVWRSNEREIAAGQAVTRVAMAQATTPGGHPDLPQALLRVTSDYPSTAAGARSLLLGAGQFYTAGKYDEAKAQFQRFARDYRDNPLMGIALFGVAACLEAQGKTNEAATSYKDLIDHHPGEPFIPQAKFALAGLYESQKSLEQARTLYIDVERSDPVLGPEAGMRVEEMQAKYPSLLPKAAPVTNAPSYTIEKK